jgi:hypothetical protein
MNLHPSILIALAASILLLGCPEPIEPDPVVVGPTPTASWNLVWFEEELKREGGIIDVLAVVDDSCSMGEEQGALVAYMPFFINVLINYGMDFQIGVLRGDLSANVPGLLVGNPPWVDLMTPDPINEFQNRVLSLGSSGAGSCESGLAAVWDALHDPLISNENAGFLRDDAGLAILVVSDEDDQAATGTCGRPEAAPLEWADWLDSEFGLGSVATAFIAGFSMADQSTPQVCNGGGGSADAAAQYRIAADLMRGSTYSICEPDWSGYLENFGLAIAAAAGASWLVLSDQPAWDDRDWDLDGNTYEPVLEVWLDRQDGNGMQEVEPAWSEDPDAYHPWIYDADINGISFLSGMSPSPAWPMTVRYALQEYINQ